MKIPQILKELEFDQKLLDAIDEMKKLYLEDPIPWIVGYSGGKDSTAVVQSTFYMLKELKAEGQKTPQRHPYNMYRHVENPIVSMWVENSLKIMQDAADKEEYPLKVLLFIIPDPKDSFWANLIGRGYPAPHRRFRWCTERMKIDPVSRFVEDHPDRNSPSYHFIGNAFSKKAMSVVKRRMKRI